MRWYNIIISDPDKIQPDIVFSSLNSDGSYNPGALNVEFDIPLSSFGTPTSAAYVRVWGISIKDIGQASDLNGRDIQVFGGMSAGLPLANPAQQGLLAFGTIQQAYGNWIDTNQSLDIIIMPQVGNPDNPKNIVMNWARGTELIPVIQSALSTAFPSYSLDTSGIVETGFIMPDPQYAYFQNMAQFAEWIKRVSITLKPINSDGRPYSGLDVALSGNVLKLIDNSGLNQATPKQINFVDLIGQPTWIGLYQIQFNCVMRGDLNLGDYIVMPVTQSTTVQASYSQYRQNAVFQGVFQILGDGGFIRHVGNYRQPDGRAWITTVNAVQVNTTSAVPGLTSPGNNYGALK